MTPRLLVATANRHKTAEIREILGGTWETFDLHDHAAGAQAEENGATFEANAQIKALAAAARFDGIVLADDSGLEVDPLGGQPGVRSARYAGPGADDAANRARLLAELRKTGIAPSEWTARFRCVIALARQNEVLGVFHGTVEGRIGEKEQGEGGFGYDPLFFPDGFALTFAQLSGAEKNAISHRGRALRAAADHLESLRSPRR